MKKQEFQDLVKKGTVLLDGATGSNLMEAGMPRGVCTEQWVYENPQPLIELQKAYMEAGSQMRLLFLLTESVWQTMGFLPRYRS